MNFFRNFTFILFTVSFVFFSVPNKAEARECFIGEITMFAGNFAPRGWAFCNGQLLAISQNSALFSILGTTYGGDGRTDFALPDLRGRVPVHHGNSTGPGLDSYSLGEKGGIDDINIGINNIPNHTHKLRGNSEKANTRDLQGNAIAGSWPNNSFIEDTPDTDLHTGSVESVGGGQPLTNKQPYQTVNYIICLQGTFPSRN